MGKKGCKSVSEDIIKPIQQAYKQIPKIFVIQTCRGGDVREALNVSGGGSDQPVPPLNPRDYIPPASGTLILNPYGEGEAAYGSFLVDALFHWIENLRKALDSKASQQQMVDDVNAVVRDHGNDMEVCLEDLMDGWLMDICRKTSDLVAKKYMIERLYKWVLTDTNSLSCSIFDALVL